MGVAASNTSEHIPANNIPRRNILTNNTSERNIPIRNQHPTPQQTEGFFAGTMHKNFIDSQFLEYGFTQPNLFLVPATNYSNVTSFNSNKSNDELNDSIFGTIRSVYGTTNTAVITPQNDASFRQYRQQNYPNYDPSKETPITFTQSQQIDNTETKKQFASPMSRIFDFIKSADYVPPEIIEGQTFCEQYNSLSNNVEQYYRDHYNRGQEARCGFIYNPNFNGQPVFKGHYGYNSVDSNGNQIGGVAQELYNAFLIRDSNSVFYWDMDDVVARGNRPAKMGARNAFKQYVCQMKVPNCSNVEPHNSECVWSVGLGRAIPAAGQAGYYTASYFDSYFQNQQRGSYPQNYHNIATTSAACPPVATASNQSNVVSLPSNCYDTNGQVLTGAQISRPCVEALLENAECSYGTIKAALTSGSTAPKYGLPNSNSFKRYTDDYNALANLFTNNLPPLAAQTAINELGVRARTTEPTSINYAARDLCKATGTYDSFDFCTEYGPTKTGPFLLECVQRVFRVKGGQKTGLKYPENNTDANMVFFNSLGTWSAVNNYIDDLLLKTKSTDINTQAKAFNDFYGINAQQFTSKFIPSVPGVEVFWFTLKNGTGGQLVPSVFLGRRIQTDLTLNTPTISGAMQFVSFFNLKTVNSNDTTVQYSFTHTDGIRILLNQNIAETNPTTGRFISAWTPSPTTRVSNHGTTCWPIKASKPNYFTVSWYRASGTGSFNQTLFTTCDASPSNINGTGPTMVMSQEGDAPMLSFEVVAIPTDTQINFFSSDQIPDYVFGDPRLWRIMPLSDIGSPTTIVNSTQFGFSNRYYGTGTQDLATNYSYLYGSCRFSSSSYRQTDIIIKNQSWRTMTMLFKTGTLTEFSLGQTRFILQYGELHIGIKKDGTTYKLSVKFGTSSEQLISGQNLLPDTTYYMIIIQDFDTEQQSAVTTNLIICCSTREIFTGNPQLPFSGADNQRYTRNAAPLWTGADSTYFLRIGGLNNLGVAQTSGMEVGWVRFFDYVFTSSDLINDMTNNWKRSWWNMI